MGIGTQVKRTLVVVAAPPEAAAVCRAFGLGPVSNPWDRIPVNAAFDLVLSGIGKANAAGATARFLAAERHDRVISVGIAGALPGSMVKLGGVVAAEACVYSDEGIQTPDGFLDCGQMGFPLGDFPGRAVPVDAGVLAWLSGVADHCGKIATVSTCSGTDHLARQVVERTGAIVEAMEGAAVVQVARRMGIAGGELRVVSNTTGDRSAQVWKVREALDRLTIVFGRLIGAGEGRF